MMRRLRLFIIVFLIAWSALVFSKAEEPVRQALQLDINGPIGPATSDYIHRGLQKAKDMNAAVVVLYMDTPGGLDTAMRKIIQDIIASPIPVLSFVAPSGARAASAGTYILYASHVAAMAPGTNLGAATPVQIGGPPDPGASDKPAVDKDKARQADKTPSQGDAMTRKTVNDAAAYLRSLAQMRGRNVDWAERAVREAVSLSAEEAVKKNVVDLTASDVPDLLARAHGRKVDVLGQILTLKIADLPIEHLELDWRSRLLSIITDPNVAYILMLLGVYGLFFELWNPGYILPGVVGAICLLLALFAFQVLPVSFAGLGLILLGIAFMVGEVFMPSFGALGIGGVIAFVVGSVMLLDTDVPGFGISPWLIAGVALISAAFFMLVVAFAMQARQRPVVSGSEEMLGETGISLEDFNEQGRVRVHSEDWQARSRSPLTRGQKVRVTGIEGLTLIVEPLEQNK